MIRKKCMTCGTLHPLDHVTGCTVCDEDNWIVTCDKHKKLKLKRTSSCPECKAEKEAAKKPEEECKRAEEEHRRKATIKKRKKPPEDGYCPHGHGRLKEWYGQTKCSTCGWNLGGPLNYFFGGEFTAGCFFIGLIPVATSIYVGCHLAKDFPMKAEGDSNNMIVFIGAISFGGTAYAAIYGIVWILDRIWKGIVRILDKIRKK